MLPELLHPEFDSNAAQIRSVVGQPVGDIYAHPVAADFAATRSSLERPLSTRR
ncbi:MAG: hypothetical protein R2824_18420 [Saprospiraceae bacterium]